MSTLISYLLSNATKEWKNLRHAADVDPSTRLTPVHHSALSKHLKSLDFHIIKCIFNFIVYKLNRSSRRKINFPKSYSSSIQQQLPPYKYAYIGLPTMVNIPVLNFM